MNPPPRKLLALIEFLSHGKLAHTYKQLGFEVTAEWQVRKAVTLARKLKPDVVVADFYHQADFRDRLSNLESLLAVTQSLPDCKVLVLYEAAHQPALDKVKQRMRIDAALTVPVNDTALMTLLKEWQG
jgi:DNA-binding NarL/FixJ family response regulator